MQQVYPIFKVHSESANRNENGGRCCIRKESAVTRKKDALAWSQTSRTISSRDNTSIWYAAAGCGTHTVGWEPIRPVSNFPSHWYWCGWLKETNKDRKHICAYSAYSVMLLL